MPEHKFDHKPYSTTLVSWYNFNTGEHEVRSTPNEEEMSLYIPQSSPVQAMYELCLKMGKNHIEAAVEVLKACVGE